MIFIRSIMIFMIAFITVCTGDVMNLKKTFYQIMLNEATFRFFQKQCRCVVADLIPIDEDTMFFNFNGLTNNNTVKTFQGEMYRESASSTCFQMQTEKIHNNLLFCILDMDAGNGEWLIVGDQNHNIVIGLAMRLHIYDDILWSKISSFTNDAIISSNLSDCFFFIPDAVI